MLAGRRASSVTSPSAQTLMWMLLALEDAAGQIGLVRVAALQPFERGLLVAEGFEEGVGERAGSNGASASLETASSISTAFIAGSLLWAGVRQEQLGGGGRLYWIAYHRALLAASMAHGGMSNTLTLPLPGRERRASGFTP